MAAEKMTQAQLESRIDVLPMLPAVISKLLALDQGAENAFEEVVQLVGADPAFAIRLIRSANSVTFSSSSPIDSIEEAALRLGVKNIVNLVTTDAVMKVFVPRNADERNMWVHAAQVAVGARTIAKNAPDFGVDSNVAFLAGLLHDIGRFIIFEQTPEELKGASDISPDAQGSAPDSELGIYQHDHTELGRLACAKWRIPEVIASTVCDHHRTTDSARSEQHSLLSVVQISDALSDNLLIGENFAEFDEPEISDEIGNSCMRPAWSSIDSLDDLLAQCCTQIREESSDLTSALGVA